MRFHNRAHTFKQQHKKPIQQEIISKMQKRCKTDKLRARGDNKRRRFIRSFGKKSGGRGCFGRVQRRAA